jgi:transposase
MSLARLVITAVKVEGRTKSEVARDYGVSRFWVQQLVHRFEARVRLRSSRALDGRIPARMRSVSRSKTRSCGSARP